MDGQAGHYQQQQDAGADDEEAGLGEPAPAQVVLAGDELVQ